MKGERKGALARKQEKKKGESGNEEYLPHLYFFII
jgi:hypothetical protein